MRAARNGATVESCVRRVHVSGAVLESLLGWYLGVTLAGTLADYPQQEGFVQFHAPRFANAAFGQVASRPGTHKEEGMIAKAIRLVDGDPQQSPKDARPSVPVLEAALEVGRQDRLWLKQKLSDRKTESDALHEELRVLNLALPEPSPPDARSADATAPAMALATQLRRRMQALWDERERLLRILQEAAHEREQMVAALERATDEATAAAQRAEQASEAAGTAAQQRDALAVELEQQRAALLAHQPAAGLPAGADADEIARALEIMAAALGDLRQRIVPFTPSPPAPPAGDARPTADLATLLAPLAALPVMQAQLERLAAQVDKLTACGDTAGPPKLASRGHPTAGN
jgi:hypothetical protein